MVFLARLEAAERTNVGSRGSLPAAGKGPGSCRELLEGRLPLSCCAWGCSALQWLEQAAKHWGLEPALPGPAAFWIISALGTSVVIPPPR